VARKALLLPLANRALDRLATWRALAFFWIGVLVVLDTGGATLALLGPPAPRAQAAAAVAATQAARATPLPALRVAVPNAPPPPGALAAPDPALLEPSTVFPGGMLPRGSAGGRTPMRAYAAAFDPADPRPRVALLVGGIGMSETDSAQAIDGLPAAVSFAVSPYAERAAALASAARAKGHEVLLAVPMEPAGYPLDDAGNQSLLTGNAPALNAQRLEWAMTRFAGYVGATGALDGLRGERFASASELFRPLLADLGARGLLYVDPRPGAAHPPGVVGRSVDVAIDDMPSRTEIEAALGRLEQAARDRGAALGLVGLPRPVTLDRVAAWAETVGRRGVVLVPVSAVATPPPAPAGVQTAQALKERS
jgi:uncharacterized protein